jgi:hypothetical protein
MLAICSTMILMPTSFSFPAHEMATPLADAFAVNSAMKASAAKAMLREARFDQAPVINDEGQLCGWVRTASLGGRGYVTGSLIPLERCVIQSLDTSVGDALQAVASSGLVYFAGRTGISAFAVASDLDRHVVRCYLYVLLSEVEMLLADAAEAELSREAIERLIRGRDRTRYEAACANDVETRPVEYLMLSAYSGIVDGIKPLVAAFPGSQNELRAVLKKFTRLRNCVAHPAKSLALEFEPAEVASLAMKADAFTTGLRAARRS